MKIFLPDGRANISGQRIREARLRMGMSQDALAAKLQVAGLQTGQMAVSRIETGKRIVPDEDIILTADWMNNYPRRKLGGSTPALVFRRMLQRYGMTA